MQGLALAQRVAMSPYGFGFAPVVFHGDWLGKAKSQLVRQHPVTGRILAIDQTHCTTISTKPHPVTGETLYLVFRP